MAGRRGNSCALPGCTRPSKLRLPDSTAQPIRSPALTPRRSRARSGPGVADAGGAAVADQVEADAGQLLEQTRLLQIVGHHARARRQAGLDPGLGASGRSCCALRASSPAASITEGLEVLVQLVMAAISTAPSLQLEGLCRRASPRRLPVGVRHSRVRAPRPCARDDCSIDALGDAQRHAILRPARAGQARLDRPRSSSSTSVYCAGAAPFERHSPCARA